MTDQPTTSESNENAPPAFPSIIELKDSDGDSFLARWFLAFERPEMWLGYGALQFLLAVGSTLWEEMRYGEFPWQLMTAVAHMQCMLAAIWIAWGPGRYYWRIPLAIAWIVGETFTAGNAADLLAVYCITMFSSAMAATIIFTIVRWLGRYRLWRENKELPQAQRLQYSLRHLLLLMLLVGFLCVGGGIVYDKLSPLMSDRRDWIAFASFASLGTHWLIAQLPVPFVVFGLRRRFALGIGIVGCIGWCLAWLPFGNWILDITYGPMVGPIPPDFWATFNMVAALSAGGTLGSLLLQRAMGYRLIRSIRREASAK